MASVRLSVFAALAPAMPEQGPLSRGPPVARSSAAYDPSVMKPTSQEGCTMTNRNLVTLRLLISGGILVGALQLFAGAAGAQNTIVCDTPNQRIYAELCKGVTLIGGIGGVPVHFTRISKTCLRLGVVHSAGSPAVCGDGGFTEVMENGTVQSGKYTVTCTNSTKTFGVPVTTLNASDQFDSIKTFVLSLGTNSKVGCTEKFRGNFFNGHKAFFEIGVDDDPGGDFNLNLVGSCPDSPNFTNYQISCEARD